MQLIGLSGYARSGKDEAALALMKSGYERIAFADKLRDFLYALNPIVGVVEPYIYGPVKMIRLQEVIDHYGWDGYKETPYVDEIRPLLQRLGTEAGRQTLWDSLWIDAAMHDLNQDGKYVVTDCRFINEADAIRNLGGTVVRISRFGIGPANSHASETSLDDYRFDFNVANDGTIEEFHHLVRSVFL